MKKLLAVSFVLAVGIFAAAIAAATSTVPAVATGFGMTGISVSTTDMNEGLTPATTHSLPELAVDKPKIKREIQPIDRPIPIRIEQPRPLDNPGAKMPR